MNEYDSSKCVPLLLKSIVDISKINKNFTICNKTSRKNNLTLDWMYLSNLINECQKPCRSIEFKGDVKKFEGWDQVKGLRLITHFSSNEINIQEEYLLYNHVQYIGMVGGNLGLFVGFSFSGFLTKLFSMLNDHVLN